MCLRTPLLSARARLPVAFPAPARADQRSSARTAGRSVPLYLSIPFLVDKVVSSGSVTPLNMFIGSTVAAVSIMGGTYAIMPAYESDLYGSKNVGAVHGRMLLFSSAASLAGPSLLISLRSRSEHQAISDLLTKIQPEDFERAFRAPVRRWGRGRWWW